MKNYQVTKTLRFKLDNFNWEKKQNIDKKEKDSLKIQIERLRILWQKQSDGQETGLLKDAQKIQEAFQTLIILPPEKNHSKKLTIDPKIKIKYTWLRTYCSFDFYNEKKEKAPNIYSIRDFDFITKHLSDLFQCESEESLDEIHRSNTLKGLSLWYYRWCKNIKKIEKGVEQFKLSPAGENIPTHQISRRSVILECLKFYKTRDGLELIHAFTEAFHNSNNSGLDKKINVLKESIKDFEKNLKDAYEQFLPYQTHGILQHKATLNYNTLNKSSKELEEAKQQVEEKLRESLEKIRKKNMMEQLQNPLEKKQNHAESEVKTPEQFLQKNIFKGSLYKKNLDEIYYEIKEWKAEQKSAFTEAVAQNKINQDTFYREFPLFDAEANNFENFANKTKEIEGNSNEINQLSQKQNKTKEDKEKIKTLKEKQQKLKQDRGIFFNKPNESIQTPTYKALCEFYKSIALERGMLNAQLKSIEKDRIDAHLLTHWAVIYEQDRRHGILMFPRENDKYADVKKCIEEESSDGQGTIRLSLFYSLTLRALEKLCFKSHENTFMTHELKESLKEFFPKNKGRTLYHRQAFETEEKLVRFYQKVLKDEKVQRNLKLQNFGNWEKEVLDKNFEGTNVLERFRVNLEKNCYIKKEKYITQEKKESLIRNYDAKDAQITSYDLEQEESRKNDENNEYNRKNHTKLWKNFWNSENEANNYGTRLNPEFSIFYRATKRDEQFYQEKHKENFDAKKARNRKTDSQYTLAISIAENSPGKMMQSAFTDPKQLQEKIDEFNQKWNAELAKQKENILYLGIDRGEKELATLCVTKFTGETYIPSNQRKPREDEKAKFHVPKLVPVTAYYLKDDQYEYSNEKRRFAIKNMSYFLEKGKPPCSKLFQEVKNPCIDMSMAKVIKGHIILNGDFCTYFNLKMLSAKRKLYELWLEKKINKDSLLIQHKNEIRIEDHALYHPTLEQKEPPLSRFEKNGDNPKNYDGKKNENIREMLTRHTGNIESIKKELSDYLEKLTQNGTTPPAEEKINHLRDAISANMVGILFKIYKENKDRCIIGLENLDAQTINKHFRDTNVHISRRLEWALYRKFQSEGAVPPSLKQTVLERENREKKERIQYGILSFIETEGTSSDCPYCEKRYDKKSKRKYVCEDVTKEKKKKQEKWDVGSGCNFDTSKKDSLYKLDFLTNPDEVAAYNIAKKVFNDAFRKEIFPQ